MKLSFDKRISVVDCTAYHDYGFYEDPLIRYLVDISKEDEYVEYPIVLFEDTETGVKKIIKITGANTEADVVTAIKTLLHEDYSLEIHKKNPFMFKADCHYEKTLFGRKPVCEGL